MPVLFGDPKPVSVRSGGELHEGSFVIKLNIITVTYNGMTESAQLDLHAAWPEQQAAQLLRKLIAEAPYKK